LPFCTALDDHGFCFKYFLNCLIDGKFEMSVSTSFIAGYIPSSLAPNIKAVDWLPQNDLLAHKDIKAFVSHVGHNSLYEAAYHGVPLVAFPLYGDQHPNAKKAEHFSLGLTVDFESTNAQQMFETTELVITEPRYLFISFASFDICFAY